VQELEYLEGLVVGGARGEEEQLVLDNRVEEGGGVGRRQVDQRGSRGGVREVERQQGAAGGRAAIVDVLEEGIAGRVRSRLQIYEAVEGLLVLIKDEQSFDCAHSLVSVTCVPCTCWREALQMWGALGRGSEPQAMMQARP
jgi:hypothetical protein